MITITLTADGTTADGTTRGDTAGPILKRAGGFMWSRNAETWVHNRTWHHGTRDLKARAAIAALEAAGIPCELIREDTAPAVATAEDVAAREDERRARAENRADRLSDRADRLEATADATYQRARDMASIIPFGQPILAGHHSQGRDERYRARIAATGDRALETWRDAQETERRAQAAAATSAHRDSLPTTLRRIERLEAERRDVTRRLNGEGAHGRRYMDDGTVRENVAASGEYAARLEVRATELDAELTYWRGHVATLEAAGERVWTRTDFAPGDWALVRGNRWMPVVKANPKNLKLQSDLMPWPLDYPYGDVRARRTAAEHAAATVNA